MSDGEGINWYGWSTPFSGYGIVMQEYAVAMDKLLDGKISIGWQRPKADASLEWKSTSPLVKELLQKPFKKERIGIIKTTPEQFKENVSDIKIGYTMVENTKVGKNWIDICNGMAAIFVPSHYLVEVFKQSGLKVPIYTVRQGINPEKYPFFKRERKDKFIFGTCGWMEDRKNWQEMIQAFTSEFAPEEPVRLVIKNTNNTWGFQQAVDPRVKFVDELWTFEQMQEFYQHLDCFLFPSRAEGAGMPPREAMATGLPVILTNWSGMADVCDSRYNYFLEPVAIDSPDYRGDSQPGFQARIDVQELMGLMRHVYENWEEAMAKGEAASKWMHEEWTWDKCAVEVIDILRKDFNYNG